MWRIAHESPEIDTNSSYAYLLWCKDFQHTSAVARLDDQLVGFVTGYVPPRRPDVVMFWQIAVADQVRGQGLGSALLKAVIDRVPNARRVEATVAQGNTASVRLFEALALDRGSSLSRTPLFAPEDFPDAHLAEDLFCINLGGRA